MCEHFFLLCFMAGDFKTSTSKSEMQVYLQFRFIYLRNDYIAPKRDKGDIVNVSTAQASALLENVLHLFLFCKHKLINYYQSPNT